MCHKNYDIVLPQKHDESKLKVNKKGYPSGAISLGFAGILRVLSFLRVPEN